MLKQKAVFRKNLNEALRVAYLFQAHLREGEGGKLIWEGELFNLENTMVSVLHEELKYKVEELKNKKVGGYAAEDQNQIRTSSWYINHPGSVHGVKFYSRDWLIQPLIY